MASREEANWTQEGRGNSRNEEDERPFDLVVAVGFAIDVEADSSSISQEAVASLSNGDTYNIQFPSVNSHEASVDHRDGGHHAEIYAVRTFIEEEKTEIIDLASTQIGTFEEATASAAVIETREYEVDEDESTRDLKRAAYSGYYAIERNENNVPSQSASFPPQATIVSIAEHEDGDSAVGAVHATFIGQDYAQLNTNSLREASADPRLSTNQSSPHHVSGNETAEATVIDSAPFHHQNDIPDWKINGEARVMCGESSTSTFTESKMTMNESESQCSVPSGHVVAGSSSEGMVASILESEIVNENVTASQEAEVLGFREIHPNEFPHETTQAELISQTSTITAAEALTIDSEYEHRARVGSNVNVASFEDNLREGVANFSLASQQAEVLGIQEDIHPNEFPNETEAHLVGQLVETFVALESNCQSAIVTDNERYSPVVLGQQAMSRETIAVDQEQSAILITEGFFDAPLSEMTATMEHTEAIRVSNHASLNDATALTSASMPTESILDSSYTAEAMVLPVATGVGADSRWPEKLSGNVAINYNTDGVSQAHEPFQTPIRATHHNNNAAETIPELAFSNDRSGGTSSSQRAAMQQASSVPKDGAISFILIVHSLCLYSRLRIH